jgi:hypothetical protein
MKTAIQPMQQLSNFPLQQLPHKQIIKKPSVLVPIKKDEQKINRININDPSNWDMDWFNNYE